MPDQRERPLSFPELAPDAPLIPVRMVNEYVYCPRLAYLMWVQAEWADSADTLEGRAKHKQVDAKADALPEHPAKEEPIHARSVSLSSAKLGITAKLDLVEGDGVHVTPVDYLKVPPKRARALKCRTIQRKRSHGNNPPLTVKRTIKAI